MKGKLNTTVLRVVHRLNAIISKSRLRNSAPIRLMKAIGKKILFRALSTADDLILAEVDNHLMYVPRRFAQKYVVKFDEPLTVNLFKQAIKPDSIVLDIGAHIGYYSLIAARCCPEGKVFAFEPGPDNYEILQRNIHINGYTNIIPIRKAVYSKTGKRQFFLAESSDSHGLYPHPLSPTKSTCFIECITIDEFLAGQTVDVIKMDIEGGEPFALEGMRETILKNRHLVLFVELNPFCLRKAGFEPTQFIGLLEDLGFDVKLIDERTGMIRRITKDTQLPEWDDPSWYANLYCVRSNMEGSA